MKAAFVDIGTNSVRYLAAEITPAGKASILARGLAAPRLGRGLARTGRLEEETCRLTLKELQRIRDKLSTLGVTRFLCVGTEALRKAENAADFIRRAAGLGLPVRVLTGEEEAELIHLGASGNFPGSRPLGGNVLVDVGGGSTEIIGRGRLKDKPVVLSLPLGCVRLKEELEDEERGEDYLWRKTRQRCQRVLKNARPVLPGEQNEISLIGLGGTFTTLAALHLQLASYLPEKVHGCVLQQREMERIARRLKLLPGKERKKVPGLSPERSDIIIPGIIIAQAVMESIGAETVTVSDRGLLFGLLGEFLG